MADGVVRKVYVCFFNGCGGDESRTPAERVAIDISIGEAPARDGTRGPGQDQGGRPRDEDRSLDQTSLQVSRYIVKMPTIVLVSI